MSLSGFNVDLRSDHLNAGGGDVELTILSHSVGWPGLHSLGTVRSNSDHQRLRLHSIQVNLSWQLLAARVRILGIEHFILNLILHSVRVGSEAHSSGGQLNVGDLSWSDVSVILAEQTVSDRRLQLLVSITRAVDWSGLDMARVSDHVADAGHQVGVVTIHMGPVLLHGVEGGGGPIDLHTGAGGNEASGLDTGGGIYPVVLATAGGLDLGVDIIDLGAQVLGHVLGGGAGIDEGVYQGGEDTHGVQGMCRGIKVEGCGGIAFGGLYHFYKGIETVIEDNREETIVQGLQRDTCMGLRVHFVVYSKVISVVETKIEMNEER